MLPDTFYHVYNHANGEENLFRCDENYFYFLQKYGQYINPVADTYAYCLMPNHIHFLIRVKSESELVALMEERSHLTGFQNLSGVISQQFSNLFNSYSKSYNNMYDRKGSLFRRPFQRKEVISESYYTKLIHYIHANPVHHGFCNTLHEWKFSSYHSFLSAKNTSLKRTEVLSWFGSNQAFLEFHQQKIDSKINLDAEF